MRYLNPTRPEHMTDSSGRPYFLWDSDLSLDEFRERLRSEEPGVRGYYLGKLLRQAKPDDAFLFVTLEEIERRSQAATTLTLTVFPTTVNQWRNSMRGLMRIQRRLCILAAALCLTLPSVATSGVVFDIELPDCFTCCLGGTFGFAGDLSQDGEFNFQGGEIVDPAFTIFGSVFTNLPNQNDRYLVVGGELVAMKYDLFADQYSLQLSTDNTYALYEEPIFDLICTGTYSFLEESPGQYVVLPDPELNCGDGTGTGGYIDFAGDLQVDGTFAFQPGDVVDVSVTVGADTFTNQPNQNDTYTVVGGALVSLKYDMYTGSSQLLFRHDGTAQYCNEAGISCFEPISCTYTVMEPSTSVPGDARVLRTGLQLSAQPNPFSHRTEITFAVPAAGFREVRVIDVLGREVATLLNTHGEAGQVRLTWDGRDSRGRLLASGVYFVRLEAGGESVTRSVRLFR